MALGAATCLLLVGWLPTLSPPLEVQQHLIFVNAGEAPLLEQVGLLFTIRVTIISGNSGARSPLDVDLSSEHVMVPVGGSEMQKMLLLDTQHSVLLW